MAKLGSIFFNRTLTKYLECKDISDSKALSLAEKLRESIGDNLDKMLDTIARADEPHRSALRQICLDSAEGISEDFFMDALNHDKTVFRTAASDILSSSAAVDSARLFKRLHEPGVSAREVISVLKSQQQGLRPEDIINNALKLETDDAIELVSLLEANEVEIDLSKLSFKLDKIDSPIFRINLLNFFGTVNEPKVPLIVARFLDDDNKVVVLEALKTLDRLKFKFDVAFLLPYAESMTGIEQQQVLKIIAKQADADLVPHLSDYLSSKSDELNQFFARIVVGNADEASFEKFLKRLTIADDWNQQETVKILQKFSNEKLSEAARGLSNHEQEFIRTTAQTLVINLLGDEDLQRIEEFALSDNWQVRERAIQSLTKSSNRGAIAILKKQVEAYPDDFVLVLRAVRKLGFGKGLEIAFSGLKHEQANVQRAALETIEQITSEKHADNVRNNILWSIPTLAKELKPYAKELITTITHEYDLPDIQIDEYTSTSQDGDGGAAPSASSGTGTQPVPELSPLDRLTPGSVWMERYHIKKEIGRGAMGRVLLVEDDMVDEDLILKFMLPEMTIDQKSVERFKREVKYARKISHRNVIRVHDILLKDGVCAISMEYFKSRGLEMILKEADIIDQREGLKILYQIASGMAAAHEQGVIHRDLKPSNVLIDADGHLKVVDFGIASAGTSAESTLTQTGSIIGSPAYMAPERAEGIDAAERSDIYSLGVMAYYIFSGKLPYVGQPMEVIARHRAGDALPVSEVNTAVSVELAELISKMMSVDPEDRPVSMFEVRDAVKSLLE